MNLRPIDKTIWVVLPCYNEQDNLVPLITRFENNFVQLLNLGFKREYIIVDDGSKDNSPAILRELQELIPLEVITHNPNQGLGATIRDGLKRAAERSDKLDIIITMDSDNSQPPELIGSMVQKILEGNHVVVASRYRYGARVVGLVWYREWMSIIAGILFKFSYNIRNIRDYTCGFRAYESAHLKKAFEHYGDKFVEQPGFQCMAEIIIKLNRIENTLFYEVPMVLRYDMKEGESKMKVYKTVINTLRMLISYKFKR
jgi:dolichol-phosphate mannosyltransferase